MKKSLQIFAFLFFIAAFAQAPEKFSYQAIIRNASNAIITSAPVGVKVSILKTSAAGSVVYAETQTATTNANGLISIQIGSGTVLSGTIAGINWATDPYFIKTEIDPSGGSSYSIAGTTQLLSVPYALYAKGAGGGGLTLPYAATSATNNVTPFSITNTSATAYPVASFTNSNVGNATPAVVGKNNSTGTFGVGVQGLAQANTNSNLSAAVNGFILGTGTAGAGVYGYAQNAFAVYGFTTNGSGVLGYSDGTGAAGSFQSGSTGLAIKSYGPIKLTNLGEAAGKVLTSDAAGNATWQNGTPNVYFTSAGGSSQTVTNAIYLNYINSWTGLEEAGGSNYNATTGEYTIPVTGYYSVKARITFAFSNTKNGPQAGLRIFVDNAIAKQGFSNNAILGEFYTDMTVDFEKRFTAGQKIKIAVTQDGSVTNTLFSPGCNLSIHLINL